MSSISLTNRRVAGRDGDGDVIVGVELVAPRGIVGVLHAREQRGELADVLIGAPQRRELRRRNLERAPHLLDVGRRIAADQQRRANAVGNDERALAGLRRGQPKRLQAHQRLAHHRPADAERARKLDLRRQALVLLEMAAFDQRLQLRLYVGRGAAALDPDKSRRS